MLGQGLETSLHLMEEVELLRIEASERQSRGQVPSAALHKLAWQAHAHLQGCPHGIHKKDDSRGIAGRGR